MSQLEQEFWQAQLRSGQHEEPDLTGRLAAWWQTIQKQVGENPKLIIGAGLTAGVILGWLIKRRG